MKKLFIPLFLISLLEVCAQTNEPLSIFDGRSWGVVLQHPDVKNVVVKPDVTYLSDEKGVLKMDVYLPPGVNKGEKRPAVVFLNAIGDQPNAAKVKSWGIYKTWPQLIAAHGYIGISMECDGSRIQESLKGIFNFIGASGSQYNIDADKLGVYAASANVTESANYLMGKDAYKGIKAAVLYYGGVPQGPYRKDLPVYFIVAEGDVGRTNYNGLWNEVMRNRAPWTIQMASNLIHAFDAFSDNDESRKVVKQTISFWKNQLDAIPPHTWPNSFGREVLAAQYGNDYKQVVTLLRPWLKDHPNDETALNQYGAALRRSNEFVEAEGILAKNLEKNPNDVFLLGDVAITKYALNKTLEGDLCVTKILQSEQLNPFFLSNTGMALYLLGKHKEGIPLFEKSVSLQPNPVNYYNLACGYSLINEKDKAFAALDQAVAGGFTSRQQFESDSDLDPLKNDERFKTLLTKLR